MQQPVPIVFQKTRTAATCPRKATEHAAGWDVTTAEAATITPHTTALVPLGFRVAIPSGWELELHPRSSLFRRHGLIQPHSVGTIDSDYRGEVMAQLHNLTDEVVDIPAGERIGQLKLRAVHPMVWTEADELDETPRGTQGFGSTGRKWGEGQ